MNNQYFLDFYEPSEHLPFGKKVAEVDITYKTYDEIQHLCEVEKEYYGRNAKVRRALMCSDHPIRQLRDYKSREVEVEGIGPVVFLAPTNEALEKDIRLFFANSFDVRNKPSLVNEMQADYGILRQVAEEG